MVEAIAHHPKICYRESYFHFHLLSDIDKDDDKFVDCAITTSADYIVTEDNHFNHLKQIPFPQLNTADQGTLMSVSITKFSDLETKTAD